MNAYLKLGHAIVRSEFILSTNVPSFLKRKYFTRIQELEALILSEEGAINPDKLRASIEEIIAIRFGNETTLSCTQCFSLWECGELDNVTESISKLDNPKIAVWGVCSKFVLDATAVNDLRRDVEVVNQLASRYELNIAAIVKQLSLAIARMEAQNQATKLDSFRGMPRRKYA